MGIFGGNKLDKDLESRIMLLAETHFEGDLKKEHIEIKKGVLMAYHGGLFFTFNPLKKTATNKNEYFKNNVRSFISAYEEETGDKINLTENYSH